MESSRYKKAQYFSDPNHLKLPLNRADLLAHATIISDREASAILSKREGELIKVIQEPGTLTIRIPFLWLEKGELKQQDNLQLIAAHEFLPNHLIKYACCDAHDADTESVGSDELSSGEEGKATMLTWQVKNRLFGANLSRGISSAAFVNVSSQYANLYVKQMKLPNRSGKGKQDWLVYCVRKTIPEFHMVLVPSYNSGRGELFSGPTIQIGPQTPLIEAEIAKTQLEKMFVSATTKMSEHLSNLLGISGANFLIPKVFLAILALQEINKKDLLGLIEPYEEIKCQLWILGILKGTSFYAMPFEIALAVLILNFAENRAQGVDKLLTIFSILKCSAFLIDLNVKDAVGKTMLSYCPEITPEKRMWSLNNPIDRDYANEPEVWHIICKQSYEVFIHCKIRMTFLDCALSNNKTIFDNLCEDSTIVDQPQKLMYFLRKFLDARQITLQRQTMFLQAHVALKNILSDTAELDAMMIKFAEKLQLEKRKLDEVKSDGPVPKKVCLESGIFAKPRVKVTVKKTHMTRAASSDKKKQRQTRSSLILGT